ncbi:hypothetical protein RHGRI_020438 [Rhododendron griersonianum]|uniref:NHL repeat-containing protein n=1 Tax=Rhododendron griersonianum TaxID=479676 RepID=A0AAV6JKB3_9ERIC|nr:hypothetical protein RHGRI_020438 [Rhododendron griersonianum]
MGVFPRGEARNGTQQCQHRRLRFPPWLQLLLGVTSYYSSRFLSLSASKAAALPSSLFAPAKLSPVSASSKNCRCQKSWSSLVSSSSRLSFSDGDLAAAMFNRLKSFAVDLKGDVYVTDKGNLAIRKISKSGHADGPGRNASFSPDFELAFIPKRCALMICDHGHKLVRQINLKSEDCARGSHSVFLHRWRNKFRVYAFWFRRCDSCNRLQFPVVVVHVSPSTASPFMSSFTPPFVALHGHYHHGRVPALHCR